MTDKRSEDELLKEHVLAKKLAKNSSKSGGTMRLKGYVGNSDSADTVCLYLTLDFDDCIYIKKSDILNVEEAPENELEFGGTCIWVGKDAEITHVRTESVKDKASFLEGDIARAQIKASEDTQMIGGPNFITFPIVSCRIRCTDFATIPVVSCRIKCPVLTKIGIRCAPTGFGNDICEIRSVFCPSLVDGCPSTPGGCELEQSIVCQVTPVDLTTQIKELVDQVKAQNAQLRKFIDKDTK